MKLSKITTIAAVSLMLGACASTSERSYEPAETTDFVYDNSKSFAMNVVDGSLGFHKNLKDTDVPKGSSAAAGVIDTLGASYMGFMANGLGGGLLGMMSGAGNDAPLDEAYGIFYVPVSTRDKAGVVGAYDYVDQKISKSIATAFNMSGKGKYIGGSDHSYIMEGDWCTTKRQNDRYNYYTPENLQKYGISATDQCLIHAYSSPIFLKYATATPDGSKGLFAVIGLPRFSTPLRSQIAAVDAIDDGFYLFQPQDRFFNIKIPFVLHKGNAWFFVKTNDDAKANVPTENLTKIYPKLFERLTPILK